jgi:hypothetical protein
MSVIAHTNQGKHSNPRFTMFGEKLRRIAAASGAAVALALALTAAPATAAVDSAAGPMPYARLAADWWTWALETPASINPLLNLTGCDEDQDGEVWFLAGTFGGTAERTCTVPAGKTLFFPVVNNLYAAFLNDPPETKSIGYLRRQAACVAGSTFSATLDGQPVTPVHERSIPFVIQLPEDNLFGATSDDIKNLMLAPSVDEGHYVLLAPLSPGLHTIIFENTAGTSCSSDLRVIYHLTVE